MLDLIADFFLNKNKKNRCKLGKKTISLSNYNSEIQLKVLNECFENFDFKNINEIELRDLLFRKYDFCDLPRKSEVNNFLGKIKRALITFMLLDKSKFIKNRIFLEAILTKAEKNFLFTPIYTSAEIYQFHLPDWKISIISGKPSFREKCFYLLSKFFPIEKDQSCKTTVFCNCYSELLLKIYREIHPNRKIILRFHDILNLNNKEKYISFFERIRSLGFVDSIETYSKHDAEIFNIQYNPNRVNINKIRKLYLKKYSNSLYTLVGTFDKNGNRIKPFIPVKKELQRVFPLASKHVKEVLPTDLSKGLSYKEYIEFVSTGEIIVDLVRINQDEGFPFRIPESLAFEKKVITNRRIIINSDIYDPTRFFVIGVDPIGSLKNFMESEYRKLPINLLNKFDINNL